MSSLEPRRIQAATARTENGEIILHLIIEGKAQEFVVAPHVAVALGKTAMDALHENNTRPQKQG